MKKIRTLKANEIECKIATISEKGCKLLLYKTARVDMDLLDETYGPENWECEYKEIKGNLYCGIRVYFGERSVIKWDCGVESTFGDKEKGEASDAFKRSGFKFGIGRELYTAPFIWIQAKDMHLKPKSKGFETYDHFSIVEIDYNIDREISYLTIKNDRTGNIVYTYGKPNKKQIKPQDELTNKIKLLIKQYSNVSKISMKDICDDLMLRYSFEKIENLTDEIKQEICNDILNRISKCAK